MVGSENGVDGTTKLFIGQYLALEDRNGVPPTVSITSPANGSTAIQGTRVTIRANAVDDVGVAAVSFSATGQQPFVDTSEPYEYAFTASDLGPVIISASATDLGNNTTSAQDVTVTIVPDPGTTVVGRVVDPQGEPLAAVTVAALGRASQTAADGTFSIPDVPTLPAFVTVTATAVRNGQTIIGNSVPMVPVRGGTTDVGDIVASATVFETGLGNLVATCCDVTVSLPFDFPLAGGVRRAIHVNDGYIWTNDGDEIDLLCCAGLTANPDNPASGVYFNDSLSGRAVITRYRMTTFGNTPELALGGPLGAGVGGAPLNPSHTYTLQLVLFADGRMQFGYQTIPIPASSTRRRSSRTSRRWTTSTSVPVAISTVAGEDVWERFNPSSRPFNLAGGFIVFSPNSARGYDIQPVPDVVAPVCTVAPASGTLLFEGEPIQVVAAATDNGSVTRVRIASSDGTIDTDLTAAPFAVPYTVPIGATSITFNVTAYDGWGNTGVCSSTVSAEPGPPPTATITSVAAGATLVAGQTVPIAVDAANRVPVESVDFAVNGVTFATDTIDPFEFLFTVPATVNTLSLRLTATDSIGKKGTSEPLTVTVSPDPKTTVQGRIVDRSPAPVDGADVFADVHGATVEVFNFTTSLAALPSLDGLTADKTTIVSAINLRNPGAMFGANPFGLGTSPSRALRITRS